MNSKMIETTGTWRDITDPRRATTVEDLEAGLKEPEFENIEIPEQFGPVSVQIDDHKIKRYAFTHDDYLPAALGLDRSDEARVGHAALLANDLLQVYTTKYAASKVVGLHTQEEMWFDSPVRIGETVTLSGSYVDAFELRGEGCVIMEAAAIGEDGRSLVRHRGTEIFKTVPGAIRGRATVATPGRRVTGEVSPDARIGEEFGPDIAVGDVLAPLQKTITLEQAAVFSRIGEYVSNTHTSLAIARAAQLRVPIVQGQQQFGCLAQLMTRAFGESFFTSGWMKVKFLVPIEVFEPIEMSGVVTDIVPAEEGNGDRVAKLDVWIRRGDGRLVTVGWASARLA